MSVEITWKKALLAALAVCLIPAAARGKLGSLIAVFVAPNFIVSGSSS